MVDTSSSRRSTKPQPLTLEVQPLLSGSPDEPQGFLEQKLPVFGKDVLGSLDNDSDYRRRASSTSPALDLMSPSGHGLPDQPLTAVQRSLEIQTELKLARVMCRLLCAMDPSSLQYAKQQVDDALQYVCTTAAENTVLQARCCFYVGVAEYALTLYTSQPGVIQTLRPMKWFERALGAGKSYSEGQLARQWINFYESTNLSPNQAALVVGGDQTSWPSRALEGPSDFQSGKSESSIGHRGEQIPSFSSISSTSKTSGASQSFSKSRDWEEPVVLDDSEQPELARRNISRVAESDKHGSVP